MTKDARLGRVIQELSDIADPSTLNPILLGKDKRYKCSANELLCILLDDIDLIEIANSSPFFDASQKAALKEIHQKISDAADDFGENVPADALIENSNWIQAQIKTAAFLKSLDIDAEWIGHRMI